MEEGTIAEVGIDVEDDVKNLINAIGGGRGEGVRRKGRRKKGEHS